MASGTYILNANEWHMRQEGTKNLKTFRKGDEIDVSKLSDERLQVLTQGPNPALVKKDAEISKSSSPAKPADGNKAEKIQNG